MPLFNSTTLRSYLAEFVVIVVGVLLAFQVEEWRERRTEQRDLAAVTQRLVEETSSNLQSCQSYSPQIRDTARLMERVHRSLRSGQIEENEAEPFWYGFVAFGFVPNIRMNTSVASELLSTGLLMDIDNPELRDLIAQLSASEERSKQIVDYWRNGIIALSDELMDSVDFYYDGELEFNPADPLSVMPEQLTRVDYDFEEIASNRRLRNLFYEAVDVHADVWSDLRRRCIMQERIAALLR